MDFHGSANEASAVAKQQEVPNDILTAEGLESPHGLSRSSLASHILRGTALYGIANLGDKVVSFFILIPLYARFLSPAAYGIIALSDSAAQFFVRLFSLSLDDSMRRLYYDHAHDPAVVRRYVSSVLWSVLGTVVIMAGVSLSLGPWLVTRFLPQTQLPFYPYVAFSLGGAIGAYLLLYRQILHQVRMEPGKYVVLSLVSFALTAGFAIVFVVLLRWGAFGMLLGRLTAGLIIATITLIGLRHWLGGGWEWPFVKETIVLSLPLIPLYLTNYGLDMADRFILALYRPVTEVGIYSLAYTFGKGMYLVSVSVSQAWSPLFFDLARGGDREKTRIGRLASSIGLLLIWIALAGTCLASLFVHLFLDARYHSAASVIPLIIASFLFQSFYGIFILSALQAKKTVYMLVSSAGAFLSNVALNFGLDGRWGMHGAAYANLFSYLVVATLMYFFAQKLFPVPYERAKLLVALCTYLCALALTQINVARAFATPALIASFLLGTTILLMIAGRDRAVLLQYLRRTIPFAGFAG